MKAFPNKKYQTDDEERGMDLRDWFAGLAMQAIVSNDDAVKYVNKAFKGVSATEGVSILAYQYADKMMGARSAK